MSIHDLYLAVLFSCVLMIGAIVSYVKVPQLTINLDFRDIIVFSGIALIAVGAHMIYEPAAYVVSGALLFWIGRPR